ncbi:hypothetical protein Ciccas_002601 [Cichlidogyrus casuarinus]|uniref:Uncharacterized protein n=1 Tax=Cichlidogyrus casuarinus TaxID=1844966 RepID=A0ABD2QGU0_9PLAT
MISICSALLIEEKGKSAELEANAREREKENSELRKLNSKLSYLLTDIEMTNQDRCDRSIQVILVKENSRTELKNVTREPAASATSVNASEMHSDIYFHPFGTKGCRVTQAPSMLNLPALNAKRTSVLNLFELANKPDASAVCYDFPVRGNKR